MKVKRAKVKRFNKYETLLCLKAALGDCRNMEKYVKENNTIPSYMIKGSTWEDIADCIEYGVKYLERRTK